MGSGFITRRVTTSTKVCFFTCRGVGMSAARECGRTLPPERAEREDGPRPVAYAAACAAASALGLGFGLGMYGLSMSGVYLRTVPMRYSLAALSSAAGPDGAGRPKAAACLGFCRT